LIIDLLRTLSQKIDNTINLNNQYEKEPVNTTISNSNPFKNVNTVSTQDLNIVSTQETKIYEIQKQLSTLLIMIQNPLTSQQGKEILERLSKLELASLLFFKSQN